MKKLTMRVNTTRGTFTDLSNQSYDRLAVVHDDTVLFCCRFEEEASDGSGEMNGLDLSGGSSLRVRLSPSRVTASVADWGTVSDYNQGNWSDEDASDGFVSWAFPFTHASIGTQLSGSGVDYIDCWVEFTWVDPSGEPQTLLQAEIRIYEQMDDGAAGSPPPSSPTYLTATEVAAAYVAKSLFDADTVLAATTDDTPAALTLAEQTILGRITGGHPAALTAAQVRTLLNVLESTSFPLLAGRAGDTQVFADDAAAAPLRMTARSAAPTTPAEGDIYLDDGTNRDDGLLGFRRYASGAWADVNPDEGRYETLSVAAGSMTARTTNGAAYEKKEYTTNDVDLDLYWFDDTTEEGVFFALHMPENWDRGTLKAKVHWTCASGGSGEAVVWGISAGALSDGDAIDAALGTEVVVSDDWQANGDHHLTAASSAITVGGTPALGDWVIFRVCRKPAHGSDDLTGDAGLIGVVIQYRESTPMAAW